MVPGNGIELGSWCLLIDDFEVSKLAFLSLHIWINYFNDSRPIWTTEIAPWTDHPTSANSPVLSGDQTWSSDVQKNRLRWILWILVGKHVPVDIPESELSWTKFDAFIAFPFFLYYSLRKPFFNKSFFGCTLRHHTFYIQNAGWFRTQSHANFTWLKRSRNLNFIITSLGSIGFLVFSWNQRTRADLPERNRPTWINQVSGKIVI